MFYHLKSIAPYHYPKKNEDAGSPLLADYPLQDISAGEPSYNHAWWNTVATEHQIADGDFLLSARFRDLISPLKIYPAQSFEPVLIESQGFVHEYYSLKKAGAKPSRPMQSGIKKPGAKRVLATYNAEAKLFRLIDIFNFKVSLGSYSWTETVKEFQSFLSEDFAGYDMIVLEGFLEPVTLVSEKTKEILLAAGLTGIKLIPAKEIHIGYDQEIMAEIPAPPPIADAWQSEFIEKAIPRIKSKKLRAFIQENTRPALHIEWKEPAESDLQPLASRLFGHPAVPPGFDWPKSPDGTPMVFVAQFNLKDINERHDPNNDFGTPKKGMLAFFLHLFDSENYAQGKKGYSRVCYFPDADALKQANFPSEALWMNDFRAREVILRRFDMIPDEQSPLSAFNKMDQMAAWDMLEERKEILEYDGYELELLNYHLFGYPAGCQAGMEYDAAYQSRVPFSLEPTPSRVEVLPWKALFNFSAERLPELRTHLGLGDFCFLIRQEDWESLRFEDVQLVGQWT